MRIPLVRVESEPIGDTILLMFLLVLEFERDIGS